MTGKYPIHLGMQYDVVHPEYDWGLPLNEMLLPEMLRIYCSYINYGAFRPDMLPTAHGFHQWFGYNTGEVYYWSKKLPSYQIMTDLLYMDEKCYASYNGTDFQDYSTFLFRDKEISVIHQHDFSNHPMFLYLAFQSVHTPYQDIETYLDGVPSSFFTNSIINNGDINMYDYDEMSDRLNSSTNRFHYGLSLALMDRTNCYSITYS
jgi:arylsulfatase B